jgi:hypothetical protein
MDTQPRALWLAIAVTVAALSSVTRSQGPPSASTHYTVVLRDGSEVDLGFARRWLDAAERLMATKYHVVPDRYHISVYLLHRPENDIDTTQSAEPLLLDGQRGSKNWNDLSAWPIRSRVEGTAAALEPGTSERRSRLSRESPDV